MQGKWLSEHFPPFDHMDTMDREFYTFTFQTIGSAAKYSQCTKIGSE